MNAEYAGIFLLSMLLVFDLWRLRRDVAELQKEVARLRCGRRNEKGNP